MSYGRWPLVGSCMASLALLVGPPLLVRWLGWPLGEHTSWAWFIQYLRSGTVPHEAVVAGLVLALWALWAAHLVVVLFDVRAALRGLTPRIGLVRMVWLLVAGGTVATSTQTAVAAMPAETPAEVPPASELSVTESGEDDGEETIERQRTLSGFPFDSAALTAEKKESLGPTIELLDAFGHPEASVTVTGYTDPIGDPAYNEALAEERAKAVADHLREHLDDTVEIQVIGGGVAESSVDTQVPYEEYRRVEIDYSLQYPPSPEPDSSEEEPSEATESSEPVGMDSSTVSEEGGALSGAGIGAAAGAIGAAAGYAVGRLRSSPSSTRPRSSGRKGPRLEVHDTPGEVDGGNEGHSEGLVRREPRMDGSANIDRDGYVLLADGLCVNSRGGLAFTGRYAGAVLGALASGHTAERTVTTRAAFVALGGAEGTLPEGTNPVSGVQGVPIAVETSLLSAARQNEEGEQAGAGTSPLLLLLEAEEVDARPDLCEPLVASSEIVVCVLGGTRHAAVEVRCERTDRVVLRTAGGDRTIVTPLRHAPDPENEELRPSSEQGVSETGAKSTAEGEHPAPVPESEGEPSEEATRAVQVRLFAEDAVVTVAGEHVTGLRSVARTFLAFLALHPHGADVAQITESCFPDVSPDKAAACRRNAMHSIRSVLRPLLSLDDAQIILKEAGRYRIDESLFEFDLWKFLRCAEDLKKQGKSKSRQGWLELLDLHNETLLHGRAELWVEPARERCTRIVVDACVQLAESTEDHSEKMQYLEMAVQFDQYNEPLYQRMMKAYLDADLPEGAHQSYRVLKAKLKELGEKPGRESRRLVEGKL
ncbi:OmpA family protein [Nocardiopsis salina]|uniref:OmpA family protein n=1 Tax=Nocardiopsis salina TaxID=245836 RepID=UPI00034C5826|nr:OmpA family protein [Nocardiopsis salina]